MRPHPGESSSPAHDRALGISLEQSPHAPALARAAVSGFSDGNEIAPARLATLLLLVSEVVTNAVIHSRAPADTEIALSASLTDAGAIRIEVTDGGDGFTPVPRDPSTPGGGYGLYLVDRESVSWGVDRSGGTRVWFELATRAP
ncbi:MAG TPA: ATP-binding protein [Solirubrobacteraceae bacterium]|jgi:anti-sigma regulatory factor (Ser/Thr protein kinase)|nr:ATP-binding protein [Solirubrobacteraceae bacterium]